MEKDETLREKFLKIYANLPIALRKEIIIVIDKEPVTWNAAYIEILNKTEKSTAMLTKLKELKII